MNPTAQPTRSLVIHPALKHLPMLPAESPEARAMIESVRQIGLLEAIKTHKGRVVDGRERLRAAIELGRDTVPCVEICDGDVHTVILHSLVARKHYTKSALAYLGFPHVEAALKESKSRQLANLASATPLPERQLSRLSVADTAEELSDQLGINRQFLFSARNIHGHFAKDPKLQEYFEPRILSGELGLGAVLQGIAGWQATKGKVLVHQQLDLFWKETIKGLADKRKFARWDQTPENIRQQAARDLSRKVIATWPDEVVKELAETYLRENGAGL